jgi:4-carboxymuconolactone decarboxylase
VLGEEYVNASMAKADDFMMAFQRATTSWAWGWAWGDPTLDRRIRSLLNLAMLTALNRSAEIKIHVKVALTNGVTVDEIRATLLHRRHIAGSRRGLMRSKRHMRFWSRRGPCQQSRPNNSFFRLFGPAGGWEQAQDPSA